MVKANTSYWSLLRQGTATGLVLLLTLIGFSRVAEAGTWMVRPDWSKVQRVPPGTRTRVRLYKDRAPGGLRKIEGRFKSSTSTAITLTLAGGNPHTLQKQDVTQVLVFRPLSNRYPVWITLGVSAGWSIPTVVKKGSDLVPWGKLLFNGIFIGVPTLIAFLVSPKWGGVYNVPRRLRDDPAPTPSATETKRSSATSGSGLLLLEETAVGPELRRSLTRRPRLREKLLLDLSSRPVHAHRLNGKLTPATIAWGFTASQEYRTPDTEK